MTMAAEPLQTALQSWAEIDLPALRPNLDQTVQSLVESRETSLQARKSLGERTKTLKRAIKTASDDGTTTSIASLATECKATIKAYQGEIDSLTKRCKLSESNFTKLYDVIYNREDPAASLRRAMEIVQSRDDQLENLLGAMEELNGELEGVREKEQAWAAEREELLTQLKESEVRKDHDENNNNNNSNNSALSLAEREELIQLRSEVAEYEVEFKGLKNQDITIRKLEAKIEQLEKDREHELQTELSKAREELAEVEGRRATEALEREAITSRKVQSLELQLRAERAGREASASQLLAAEDGLGEHEAAWEAQKQILVGDADRLREELAECARERDEVRLRMEAVLERDEGGSGGDGTTTTPPSSGGAKMLLAEYMSERKAYEAEIGELSDTCNALREELRAKEDSISEERTSAKSKIEVLERERVTLTNQLSSLELKVANAPSQDVVDKMRHELRILKRLEYNALDIDHNDRSDPETTVGDDLESVLVAKLRKVEADLVRERREKSEGVKEREELNSELDNVKKSLGEAEELVASLENDLQLAVQTPTPSKTTSRSNSSSAELPYAPTNPPNPNTLQKVLDPNAPLIVDSNPITKPPTASAASQERANDDHSVATIVMAQRDRLRARCDALEAERDSFKRELQVQVQTSESLKTDNTKLYEKVRYLQSFNATSGGSMMRGRNSSLSSDRDLDIEALESRYEASVDPFRQFSRAERQRKYNEMSPLEKVVFIVAKTTLGSKEMRKALFFYVLGMHLLVFVTTYHWSHSSSCDFLHKHEALAHFHGGMPLPESPAGEAAAAAHQAAKLLDSN
ncbi:CASP C-terminal domain-containing protein [Skeletonema marinoi]|uniref:Protein CASP n=1 Tax=Skeletonema marinoi TaxID=267567 RepID=A0AAD8XYT8_9STRA|nr:CASP C-terminal domain-containing protein [Skeletonema marinoi]